MYGSKVLIVRHGEGRGRLVPYCQHVLDYLTDAHPELRERIHVHETGTDLPSLEGFRAVVFWLGDPLRPLYPTCYTESLGIEREAQRRGVRIVNPPSVLADYSKSRQSRAFRAAGLPTPDAVAFTNHEEFQELARGLDYPALIRGDTAHAQECTFVLTSAQQALEKTAGDLPSPGVATRLIDVRSGYRKKAPLSIWARLYHVKRVIVIGASVIPESVRFGREPIVTNSTSTLGRFADRRKRLRVSLPPGRRRGALMRALKIELKVSRDLRSSLSIDRHFVKGAIDDPGLFLRAARVLGLDLLAFDYSTLANGDVVLWEANPYPHLLHAGGFMLPAERRTHERTLLAYEAFATLFEELLGYESTDSADDELTFLQVT